MDWLRKNCPYFTEDYLDYLGSYRFQPKDQIKMDLHVTSEPGSEVEEGYITIDVSGLWVETILYEVPVMSILSEAFFLTVDRGWSHEGQEGTSPSLMVCSIPVYERMQSLHTRKLNG